MLKSLIFIIIFFTCSCSHKLAPTPNLFSRQGHEEMFFELPEEKKNPLINLIYVTDRTWDAEKKIYGTERSRVLEFGECEIQFGELNTWQNIYSISRFRDNDITIDLNSISPKGFFPTPFPVLDKKGLYPENDVKFVNLVEEKLKTSRHKEVFVFVHGFNNTFEYAAKTTSQLWHYIGRKGLGIVYSWPSGTNGVFGYGADKESGDFTIFHLKQFLRSLHNCQSIEKINILAHSRGTDVTITALRELYLELKNQSDYNQKDLKLNNLILAAADIDTEVFLQRFFAEGLHKTPNRLTLYIGAGDLALSFSQSMNISARRLGLVKPEDIEPEGRKLIKKTKSVNYIYIPESLGIIGHSYFIDDPAVSSDLVLLLRDDKAPGIENGRPLKQGESGFWFLERDYPQFKLSQ